MASENRTLEIKGEDVDKAVAAGLAQLGLERADVNIEVLDEGSSGFLGLGGRDASVRLTAITEATTVDPTPVKSDLEAAGTRQVSDTETAGERHSLDGPDRDAEKESASEQDVALEVVNNLLEKMQLETTTSLHQTEPDDLTDEQRWVVDVRGDDLGVLIGQRGETLNALQFVARLITGHTIHRRPKFIVDVENYRERREQALARLADRMASKVVKRGRPLSLEPMPPNERRIIHITLRDHEHVYTESTGEGSRRKVRILPK